MATGLMIIGCGKATKKLGNFLNSSKEYVFEASFGQSTDSYDAKGQITATTDYYPSQAQIIAELDNFRGQIEQLPPAFSALKVSGKRAYKLARQGQKVNLEPRSVKIEELLLIDYYDHKALFKVKCSKGTYVRSLAHDLGQACGSLAYVSQLERTAIDQYQLNQAISFENLAEAIAKQDFSHFINCD